MSAGPLTDEEKTYCLFYLGYAIFEDDGPAVRALNSLNTQIALHPAAAVIIREQLHHMHDVRRDLHEVRPLTKAIEDGSVKLRAHYTIEQLCRLGRMYVNQLSGFTKISIFSDVFSPGGAGRNPAGFYSGDPSEKRIDASLGVPTVTSGGLVRY